MKIDETVILLAALLITSAKEGKVSVITAVPRDEAMRDANPDGVAHLLCVEDEEGDGLEPIALLAPPHIWKAMFTPGEKVRGEAPAAEADLAPEVVIDDLPKGEDEVKH